MLSGRTQILGIFGDPVEHSLSPVMQNAALKEAGIDAVYVPFHVVPEQLPAAVASLRSLQIRGVNATIPHKETICSLLDDLDEDAALIGAVNTVVNQDGRLIGYNTDGAGLVASLKADLDFDPVQKSVLVLGAGGAARAAIVSLLRQGCRHVTIANRTPERARQLVYTFQDKFKGTTLAVAGVTSAELTTAVAACDLVLNTTSIGLQGEAFSDFPWGAVSSKSCFYDMVYRRGGTPFVARAKESGARAVNGLGMLAAQGELAFELWTGQPPPSGVMKCRLLAEVADI